MTRHFILFSICFFFLPIILFGQSDEVLAQFEERSFLSSSGHVLPYRLLSPDKLSPNNKLPLVIFLHGAGERGNDNKKQLLHGGELFMNNLDQYPAIVVFPQCGENSYWSRASVDRKKTPLQFDFNYAADMTPDLEAVNQLITRLIKEYPIDKKRIYIAGLSMGGMGTFEIVHRFPKQFAAAMPICGAGSSASYTKKAKKVPFWIFHGADDVVVSVEESRKMVNALQNLQYKVKYTEYPGVNHDSWTDAFAEKNFLKWMFERKR